MVKEIWKIVGIGDLPPPTGIVAQRAAKVARRERAQNAKRRIAFRMVANVCKDQIATKSFKDQINEERQVWEEEESAIITEAQEETIASALKNKIRNES